MTNNLTDIVTSDIINVLIKYLNDIDDLDELSVNITLRRDRLTISENGNVILDIGAEGE